MGAKKVWIIFISLILVSLLFLSFIDLNTKEELVVNSELEKVVKSDFFENKVNNSSNNSLNNSSNNSNFTTEVTKENLTRVNISISYSEESNLFYKSSNQLNLDEDLAGVFGENIDSENFPEFLSKQEE